MNDYVRRPREPYDAHLVIKRDLANIIAQYTDRATMKLPLSTRKHLPVTPSEPTTREAGSL